MENLINISLRFKYLLISFSIYSYSFLKKEILFNQTKIDDLINNTVNTKTIDASLEKVNVFINSFKNSNNKALDKINKINFVKNYRFNHKVNKIRCEVNKIRNYFRDHLNFLNSNLYDEYGFKIDVSNDNLIFKIDYNNLFIIIDKFYLLKKDVSSQINDFLIIDYLFFDTEEVILRLLNIIVIYDKSISIISKENMSKIIDLCNQIIKNPIEVDSKRMYAQRILINLMSKEKDFFYDDFLLEFKTNEDIIKKNDYNIVFLHGLNANFSKGWRIHDKYKPSEEKYKLYFNFLLKGTHADKLFYTEKFNMWVPRMLQNNAFKEYNINYVFGNYETYSLESTYHDNHIPHIEIDDIAKSLYISMNHSKIAEKPFILVCHSMGGLIAKRILHYAKENNNSKLLENLRGVIFFSTPHFGSDVIISILKLFVFKYEKLFKLFQTTSNEYGLDKEDIIHNLSSLKLSKPTRTICTSPIEYFNSLHENFRTLNIPYVCFIESKKSFIKTIDDSIYIVKPDSSILPESNNIICEDKFHSNIQKFKPNQMDDPIFLKFCEIVKNHLIKN